MTTTLTIAELNRLLEDVLELQGVAIEGDFTIELADSGIDSGAMQTVGYEVARIAANLNRIAGMLGYQQVLPGQAVPAEATQSAIPQELIPASFNVDTVPEWKHTIEEVTLGATSSDGGSRGRTITIGGENALPYYFDSPMPNRNYVSMDVFDMPIGMARAVRTNYEDVLESPADWAKKVVSKFGADMVTIHLISTDPAIKDTPAREAANVVEDVLQAVDVPIIIGGSGNPDKDPEVLEKAAEAAEGERCLIASANLNMDYQRIAGAAKEYGHAILSWTQLEINAQKELNRKLMKQCEIKRSDIVMDPTTAALGYGLDYAYSNIERIRIAGLIGDSELNFPMSSGTTNAWGARESWMAVSPTKGDSDWGPREYRGPIWEITTGLALALAGVDLFMMMHPTSVQVLKTVAGYLRGNGNGNGDHDSYKVPDWVGMRLE
ncbi:MAG: Acetyl-CoA decarbonylase/synthase complex subunit delta 1 [Candidatus Methanogasteraceae archaeon]|nr:MAG: Acetyl-CoA decarbonylase/synthase complex subunit delta 1 [ANME-2 cluster archaeon]